MVSMNIDLKPETLELVMRALVECDSRDALIWGPDHSQDGPLSFAIHCSEVLFYTATADVEDLTDENAHLLPEAIRDLQEIGGHWLAVILATDLFCARARKMNAHPYFLGKRRIVQEQDSCLDVHRHGARQRLLSLAADYDGRPI